MAATALEGSAKFSDGSKSNVHAVNDQCLVPPTGRTFEIVTNGIFLFDSNFFRVKQDHRSERKSLQSFEHPHPLAIGATRPPQSPVKPTTYRCPTRQTLLITLQTCTAKSAG
jgi:hypothetical protein